MKKLPDNFRKEGFDHKVLKREGDVALLSKSKDNYHGFEVVVVQSHNGYRFGNELFPPAEFMPRNEDWGSKGFTCSSREAAEVRFTKLLKAQEQPKKLKLKK